MNAVTDFFDWLLNGLKQANFPLLVILLNAAFAALFVAVLLLCIFSRKARAKSKRPFAHVVNLFAAVNLAVFLTRYNLSQAVAACAVFWVVGYLLYGVLCLFNNKKVKQDSVPYVFVMPAALPKAVKQQQQPVPPRGQSVAQPVQAAQTGVRLEHALSISDKLLLKNLGRGDRQELEKIKTALTVLKVKGVLETGDGEALNDMFNALLKFMAKYDM